MSSFTVTLSTNWNKPRWSFKIPVGFMGEEVCVMEGRYLNNKFFVLKDEIKVAFWTNRYSREKRQKFFFKFRKKTLRQFLTYFVWWCVMSVRVYVFVGVCLCLCIKWNDGVADVGQSFASLLRAGIFRLRRSNESQSFLVIYGEN